MSEKMLQLIKTRRVIRSLTDEPVERSQLAKILEAARWAPCGGNRRVNRYVVIQDTRMLRLIRMVSPGMYQRPPALILICIDWNQVREYEIGSEDKVLYIDIGTATENMMLAAHAIGLATGPVTSFSTEAVRVLLNLPQHFTPELFLCVGKAARGHQFAMGSSKRITWQSLTNWERFEE
jgi:nitroreductase